MVSSVAEGIQEATDPASKAAAIVGRAVATIVVSSVATIIQLAKPRKTTTIFLVGKRFVWSVSMISGRSYGLSLAVLVLALGSLPTSPGLATVSADAGELVIENLNK